MRHNQYRPGFLFVREPVEFSRESDRDFLCYCLGATLYMPATRDIADKLIGRGLEGMSAMVMCFEDAIQESQLSLGESNARDQLARLRQALDDNLITPGQLPLIFFRVRNPEQFRRLAGRLSAEQAAVLTGFVFPKISRTNGEEYFRALEELNSRFGRVLYAMPILEGRAIACRETRGEELAALLELFRPHRDLILNVRVGGADFSSVFGVRRGINHSIYDIITVRDCLADILNFFARDSEDYVISAPVWEYFPDARGATPEHLAEYDVHHSLVLRPPILNQAVDGLLREVILDRANGFIGKTVIHPSHLRYVNVMYAVTSEEYDDAVQIFRVAGGAVKSARANKMNEINPHRNWARKIMKRAEAYGVVENETSYLRLFAERPAGEAGRSAQE